MTAAPRVSFVVPCHDHGAYLDEAVDSIFAQTVQDFEIVIVNDGSTDAATNQLLAGYTRPRTSVVHTAHRGLPAARNAGIARASGQFLCMLDADDRLEPTYLERSLAAFDEDEGLAFVSHWFRAFGDETWDWTPADCSLPALLQANTVNGAALVRREAFDAVGGFDESMRDGCEDWDFWISVLEHGYRGRILAEFLFRYRRRPDSMSRVKFAGNGLSRLYRRLIEKHSASFERHLPEVLGAQERDWGRSSDELDDVALDLYEWTGPERDHLRDRLSAIEHPGLRGGSRELGRPETELARTQAALEAATTQALAFHAESNRAQGMLDEMRASASWRLTRPLRALWRAVARVRMGRR